MSLQTHAVWLAAPARKRNRRNEAVCTGEHAPFPIPSAQLSMVLVRRRFVSFLVSRRLDRSAR